VPALDEDAVPLDDGFDEPLIIMGSAWEDEPIEFDDLPDLDEEPEKEPVPLSWRGGVVQGGRAYGDYNDVPEVIIPARSGRIIAPETTAEGMVKVGNLFLDPKRFPIACTIATQGLAATTEALDNQIREKAFAAMQRSQAQRPAFVPLMLGQ
jgi:hypothetical protein